VDLSLYFAVTASGQISAKSSRGRVIRPTFAACFSRQRILNEPSVFSTVMASQKGTPLAVVFGQHEMIDVDLIPIFWQQRTAGLVTGDRFDVLWVPRGFG
jgi:hypothetical protein